MYFLKKKDETFSKFVEFKAFIEKQTGKEIKALRTDDGGKYMSKVFEIFLVKHGIKHETTVPYTPEQNGVAERMNRTLTEKAKCFLFDADLPKTYWAEAINMAAYVVNRMPCSKLTKMNKDTPEEFFSNKKSDLTESKLFGLKVMVLRPKQTRSQFDENSTKMIFVGYDDCVKGYRCVNISTRKLTVSRNVKFFEKMSNGERKVNYLSDSSGQSDTGESNSEDSNQNSEEISAQSSETVNDDDSDSLNESNESSSGNESDVTVVNVSGENETSSSESHDDTTTDPTFNTRANTNNGIRSSSRTRTPYEPYQHFDFFAFLVELNSEIEPNSVSEAMKSENREKWTGAMNEEIESHVENETWKLVDLPSGRKPITAKWVFKVKSIGTKNERFKARLVAR